MVEDLAAEVEGADALAKGAIAIHDETVMNQNAVDNSTLVGTVEVTAGVLADSAAAMSRYSFALCLLDAAKNLPSES